MCLGPIWNDKAFYRNLHMNLIQTTVRAVAMVLGTRKCVVSSSHRFAYYVCVCKWMSARIYGIDICKAFGKSTKQCECKLVKWRGDGYPVYAAIKITSILELLVEFSNFPHVEKISKANRRNFWIKTSVMHGLCNPPCLTLVLLSFRWVTGCVCVCVSLFTKGHRKM